MRKPGLVILSLAMFPDILPASPTPTPDPATPVSDSATIRIISTSTRVLVIASVIGRNLSITLCFFKFLFFDPTLRQKPSCIFRCGKREDPQYAKGISLSDDKGSIDVDQPSSPQHDHTLIEKSPSPTKRKNGGDETLLDDAASPVTLPSKFSVYSSEYRRASLCAESKPTGAVTFASSPKSPSHPPRPPTAKSPITFTSGR